MGLAAPALTSEPSRHKCLIYDGDPSEQLPVVIPFLLNGLRSNWRCLYIGSPMMIEMVETALAGHGMDPQRAAKAGRLVLSSERIEGEDGGFEPRAMVKFLCALIDDAVLAGYEGLCATGDMFWELGGAKNFERLLEYEACLEQTFREKPLRGICQYRSDLVPGHAVRHALLTHQTAYIGGRLSRDNLFYMPPELLLENEQETNAAAQGEWMCEQIVRVLEAEEKRDEALAALQTSEAQQRRLSEELAEMNRELERRVMERTAQLEFANKELEAFSYSVSHDLRSPLQTILGFSEMLAEQNGAALGEDGRKRLQRVINSGEQMKELMERLLTLAGVVRAELKRETIDLSELAGEVARELRERDSWRTVEIVIQDGMQLAGDRPLIRAAMTNLMGNAWKFTAKACGARIEAGEKRNESGKKIFFVKDNGAGFEMKDAEKLFGAFQRLHEQREFVGTGIGLATVQRIIAKHGGRIWAEGRPNEGATFWFTVAEREN